MRKHFLLAVALILADQLIKTAVIATIPRNSLAAGGWLAHIINTGVTFGFLPGSNTVMIVVSLIAIAAIGYALRNPKKPDAYGLILLLAGVSGNLIDRIVHGGVIDYVRIGSFPVFNLADSMIVTGIIVLLVLEIPAVRQRV